MTEQSIYRDIAQRSGGDIYIGVVGPVRVGKSTFIRRFLEHAVLPYISDSFDRERTLDSMPQAGSGRTVMTTEPKFIPDEAVRVSLPDRTTFNLRLIDCVGYIVPEALGQTENGMPRMVNTPWNDTPIPFAEAAEAGTHKVICDHSNVAFLVTTDGSIGEIERENYVKAEERVASELLSQRKPFVIVLNSATPNAPETVALGYALEDKYGVPVALVNCMELSTQDIFRMMELLLAQFPVREMRFQSPLWLGLLDRDHPLRHSLFETVAHATDDIWRMGDVRPVVERFGAGEDFSWSVKEIDGGKGVATVEVTYSPALYFAVLSELTGIAVKNEADLLSQMKELSQTKAAYDKVKEALEQVHDKGYGIVMPSITELRLEEPRIVKQSGGYGVKLRASAESIHMIRANIETEINPVVGTEMKSEEMAQSMVREFEEDPRRIWESNMFGKSLHELLSEGIHTKLAHMPEESRAKLSETLERIINEGSSGLICILL